MNRLLPRNWTLRSRLTVLFGGLFFLAGAILLALTYLLVAQSLTQQNSVRANVPSLPSILTRMDRLSTGPDGRQVPTEELLESFRQTQDALRDEALDSLLTQGGIALAGTGVIASAFGWLLARRALHQVHRITETAQRIAASDAAGGGLHERIELVGPQDEVAELANTFNAMLERLGRSFDGQHRFIANASHEMRTPLAIKRALIEVTISRPGISADAQRLGGALLEVNARHERLIDGLLTLADSENELANRSLVDLADVIDHVLHHQLAATAGEAGVDVLSSGTMAYTPVIGDAALLERLTQNLVENAIRHNRPDGWVSAGTGMAGGQCTLVISNTGQVIRPYEIGMLFQPFRRLDRERAAGDRGFGLGLSIARAICRAHGGEITATPRPQGGLDVTVVLPKAVAQ